MTPILLYGVHVGTRKTFCNLEAVQFVSKCNNCTLDFFIMPSYQYAQSKDPSAQLKEVLQTCKKGWIVYMKYAIHKYI